MPLNFKSLLGLWIPTLVLLLTAASPHTPFYRGSHETYGAGDWYLDLYFDLNPKTDVAALPTQKFEGFLVVGDTQEKVRGTVSRSPQGSRYFIAAQSGTFVGHATVEKGKCEPKMKFEFTSFTGTRSSGSLNGAFCP